MLLYPILCPSQHASLTRRGLLTGRWQYVDPHHIPAYRWMVAAMLHRGIDTKGRPPIWAWHSHNPPHRRKPDLRSSFHLTRPGSRAVRLVVEAPDDLVVLSGYEAWHAVLNNWYLSLTEQEDSRVERQKARGKLARGALEASWDRIFDLRAGDPDWRGKPEERPVQACLPYLDARWIIEATPFQARGKRDQQ